MDRRWYLESLAGLLAAAVALGFGELTARLIGETSLVVAVGDVIVDYTPGDVVKSAIDTLGTKDKPALLLTITIASLVIGAALGPLAGRYRLVGALGFAGFGMIGALAGVREPMTETPDAVITATVAALSGYAALWMLLDATSAQPAAHGITTVVMPGRGVGDRRRFLVLAGGAAVAAAGTALLGRRVLGPTVDVEAQRDTIALPSAGVAPEAGGLAVEGISPLITPNDDFYRIDTALSVPRVDAAKWRLGITGMVDTPYELTFDELLGMATLEVPVTLSCVSNEVGDDLVGNAVWLGAPLGALLDRAGVQEGATQIVGRSVDDFTVGFPTDTALDGRPAMVAVGMNGEPLPASHGFPARLIVPGLYGYVSATKWLDEIELTTLEAFDAYWVPRGWAKEAPIKTQSRIDVPRGGTIRPGSTAVAGVAWGGIRSIDRVEVQISEERAENVARWREARLGVALSRSAWRQWVLKWDATPGDYRIAVRATDGTGETQTAERHSPAPDGATGHHTITVRVRDT